MLCKTWWLVQAACTCMLLLHDTRCCTGKYETRSLESCCTVITGQPISRSSDYGTPALQVYDTYHVYMKDADAVTSVRRA